MPDTITPQRIFISYKRNAEPDERIALQIHNALRLHHYVFIDQVIGLGTKWANRIESELHQSDFLITFLSSHSIQSEMVLAEIETAHHLFKAQGKPQILPVRLNFDAPFEYPLSAYLNPLNWANWKSDADTAVLVTQLLMAIGGGSLTPPKIEVQSERHITTELTPPKFGAQPLDLEQPEGTMSPTSTFYVERESDRAALSEIARKAPVITIKGPRQIGKSSLLMRIIDKARLSKRQVVFIDFQLFDNAAKQDASEFFRRFIYLLIRRLKLPNHLNEFWDPQMMSVGQLCTEYVEDYILPELDQPLLIAMDEVESIFDTNFRTEFFGMLRAWHNYRAHDAKWNKIDLALVTSTEPYQFIENLNQSPFNVGIVIEIADFNLQQVQQINLLHNNPLNNLEVTDLYHLLNGHPYLTRRAIYLVRSEQYSMTRLMQNSADWNGPFGDHLRNHLFRVQRNSKFITSIHEVITNSTCSDEEVFHQLNGAGLIRREDKNVIFRCRLYKSFFQEHIRG